MKPTCFDPEETRTRPRVSDETLQKKLLKKNIHGYIGMDFMKGDILNANKSEICCDQCKLLNMRCEIIKKTLNYRDTCESFELLKTRG